MTKFSERIKKVRGYIGLNQQEFSILIESGLSTLTGWEENRHIPRPPTIRKMMEPINDKCKEMGLPFISFHWLRTGEGEMTQTPFQKDFEDLTEAINFGNEAKLANLRGKVTDIINKSNIHPGINIWAIAGMGGGYFAPDERKEPMERIEVANLLNHKYKDAFRAWGQSMLPVIRHNALCFCDFNDRAPKGEEIYVFNLPSFGIVIKELRSHKEGGAPLLYEIFSYNAKPEYYTKEEIEAENFIIGRVTLIHQETNK